MTILTKKEKGLIRRRLDKESEYHLAVKKLQDFQETKIDREYVKAVEELFPIAEQFAVKHGNGEATEYGRLFLYKMNQLCRVAGLRK